MTEYGLTLDIHFEAADDKAAWAKALNIRGLLNDDRYINGLIIEENSELVYWDKKSKSVRQVK